MNTTIALFRNANDTVRYRAGETIFAAGDAGDHMYVVIAGAVEIRRGEQLLAVVGVDEVFGEMALIDRGARSALALARTDCTLAPVDERRFLYMVSETPLFALQVMRVLVERLRATHDDPHVAR